MPIYDYVCSSCRHRVEVIHRISDAGPRFCPSCGTEGSMRKALVTPAIHFKGSGWAKKDRSSASSARTKASNAASSTDGASGDGGSSGSGSSGPDSSGSGSPDSKGGSSDTKSGSTGAKTAATSSED